MQVEVLGSGCASCRRLEANVRQALRQAGIDAEIVKVEDVVDEQVLVSGRVPSPSQIAGLLQGLS